MIDLHCHFLPGIDDGPETLREALDLARAAVADGITHSVLTSHIHPNRYPNRRKNLETAVESFKTELAKAQIPLQVRMGAEARLCAELIDLLAMQQVPFLGEVDGHHIALLEFPHQLIPVGSIQFVNNLMKLKIRPLIAHPERNKGVISNFQKLSPFADAGCWFQITAGSLVGKFGAQAKEVSFKIIEEGWNCLIATDAHNLNSRPPLLSEGRDAILSRYGADMAASMVLHKPAKILGLELVMA